MWTYAVGLNDDGHYPDWNCPCATIPGPDSPAFVGHHYYCESGSIKGFSSVFYTSDILWDRYRCYNAENDCCTNPDMPWFFWKFLYSMQDYLEVRVCHKYLFNNGDTVVEGIELYIR